MFVLLLLWGIQKHFSERVSIVTFMNDHKDVNITVTY